MPETVITPKCRVCGCTDADCSGCVAKTGLPCSWVENDLCSACAPKPAAAATPIAELLQHLGANELIGKLADEVPLMTMAGAMQLGAIIVQIAANGAELAALCFQRVHDLE